MRRYLTEFIGTFFLVLTVGLTGTAGSPMEPIAVGSALMIMVYMGGHVSGGHYNPAVSLALLLRGKMESVGEFVGYVLSQLAGAIVAALATYVIVGQTVKVAPGSSASTLGALLIEILFTFALALVVLNVATSAKTQGNSFYGLAIGFTVVAGALAGGLSVGGAFKPAGGTRPILVDAMVSGGSLTHLWLYLVGPFVGGALAAGVFGIQEVSA